MNSTGESAVVPGRSIGALPLSCLSAPEPGRLTRAYTHLHGPVKHLFWRSPGGRFPLPLLFGVTMIRMKLRKYLMTWDRLRQQLPKSYSPQDVELVRRAYELAERAHADQKLSLIHISEPTRL